MDKLNKMIEKVQSIQERHDGEKYKCFRPWIEYNEKTGFTVTVYYADDFLDLMINTIIAKDDEKGRQYLKEHIAGQQVFKEADGIKEYIEGIVKGRKPCFIGGEYDKEENAEKVKDVLRATGYGIL